MPSITSLTNYSKWGYALPTTSITLTFDREKIYSGYILNHFSPILTITITLIDENNQLNQLDPMQLNTWEQLTFKNLLLYQIEFSYANAGNVLSYNIVGIKYNKDLMKDLIPEVNFRLYPRTDGSKDIYVTPTTQIDRNNEPYVNIGVSPQSIQGIPYSFDVTVGTSSGQIQTNINQMLYQVIILADSANTAAILIGGATGYQTYPLTAGQVLVLNYVNPYKIYAYSSTTGQKLHVIMMI